MLDTDRYTLIFLASTSAMQGHISNSLGCFSFLSSPLVNSCEVTDLFTLVAFPCQGRAFLSYMARACNPTEFSSLHGIHLGCTALLLIGRTTSCINRRITACQLVLRVRLASCVDGEIFPCQSELCFFKRLHGFTDCNNSLLNLRPTSASQMTKRLTDQCNIEYRCCFCCFADVSKIYSIVRRVKGTSKKLSLYGHWLVQIVKC